MGNFQQEKSFFDSTGATRETRTPIQSDSSGEMYVIIGVVGSVVAVIVVLSIVCCCIRSGRKKVEQYSVHYHQDSNILTLDGLSESHASDPVQSRLNGNMKSTCVFELFGMIRLYSFIAKLACSCHPSKQVAPVKLHSGRLHSVAKEYSKTLSKYNKH